MHAPPPPRQHLLTLAGDIHPAIPTCHRRSVCMPPFCECVRPPKPKPKMCGPRTHDVVRGACFICHMYNSHLQLRLVSVLLTLNAYCPCLCLVFVLFLCACAEGLGVSRVVCACSVCVYVMYA